MNSSNVLAIHNADINDSGVYNCIVFNADSNSTIVKSDSADVTVLGISCIMLDLICTHLGSQDVYVVAISIFCDTKVYRRILRSLIGLIF